jgi:plastocyanin
MRGTRLAASLVALALPVVAAGCGDDSDSDDGNGGGKPAPPTEATTLRLTSPGGRVTYDKQRLSTPAGRVTIVFTNDSDARHNVIVIPGRKLDHEKTAVLGMDVIGRDYGKTRAQASANLKSGNYTYYCSVYNHAERGMTGRLIVD